MNITVIGTGYVGLVTGACFSDVGNNVTCIDIDDKKIDLLNNGIVPIFEDRLDSIVEKSAKENRLSFSTNFEEGVKSSKIIFLAVSTPMNGDGSSKLDYILNAAEQIGKFINEHKIIVVKSTVPVGTTILIEQCIYNEIEKRNIDISFDIANNPEFLKEGKAVNDFMRPDRIIVGLKNKKIKEVFRKLYKPFSVNHEKLIFLDIPSSELTKYAANAMLALKISFINEISQLCEKNGANINDVRKGIGSDNRIGYSFIYPSIGFGGSCFPKDVNSLMIQFQNAGLTSLMSRATLDVNKKQGENFAHRIINHFKNTNKKNMLSVWGITFKPGTDDIRESQAVKIVDILLEQGYKINLVDPEGLKNAKIYYKDKSVKFYNDKYDSLDGVDGLVLLTEWPEFRSPNFKKIKKLMKEQLIFDGRNIYDATDLKLQGFKYFQIGVKD
tara:strand:- start:33 stop:1355 length:1323 start_codon:yes stop_codon:yes gene_type:complete